MSRTFAALACLAWSACCGGGARTPTQPPPPPSADAGVGASVDASVAAVVPTDAASVTACTTAACRIAELQRLCDEHDLTSCNNLGSAYFDGRDVPKDLSRARALWTEGCDDGFATACFNVANLDWAGDKKTWQTQMSRGCDLKSGLACVRLGEAHASGDLGVVDDTRAAQYFELACELGRATGCRLFAAALRAGRGVTADPERATEVERRACELLHKDDQGAANCF